MYRVMILIAACATAAYAQTPASQPSAKFDVKRDGAFGFPQRKAAILCDDKDLRVSIWNDQDYLFVQAVLWKDDDDSLGETSDGRKIGDHSTLAVDADNDRKVTPNVDRNYTLNPWPTMPGLRYSILFSETSSSHILSDSKGRGSIRYVETDDGRRVRVDSYVIPLEELKLKSGGKVGLVYLGSSIQPAFALSSLKPGSNTKPAYSRENYDTYQIRPNPASLDFKKVPEGREDQVVATKPPTKPVPKLHSIPPEITAAAWINTDKPPTLKSLQGKVVVIDFWATWCSPCIGGIPHLNDLHDKYKDKGLYIIGMCDQSKQGIENFIKTTPMKYALGTGSDLAPEYGVAGFPHAFIIARDGMLAWEGNPTSDDFEKEVVAAVEAK